jgi:hypothetical protein
MDPSSTYAMQRLIGMKDKFDLSFACDTDHDRHGIVTKSNGLLAPNHYLSAAIFHLFQHRPEWAKEAAVGKTVVSSQMIDRVTAKLGRELYEVPAGFKWFVDGLLNGSLGFGGEESAGATFARRNGAVWTTDKGGIVMALLAAEITARMSRDPGETLPAIDLSELSLPADLPVSLPSELVRQRPDILSAESLMHVASANIGIATAAMYPSFSLSGTYGGATTTLASLSTVSKYWSIGPTVTTPVFQGNSLWYARRAAFDAYQQSQAAYRQTVLGAFEQVADSLKALEHDAEGLQAQVEAKRAAGEALNLLQVNYRAGLVAYSDLLAADVQFHQATIGYLQALAQRQQDTVALFVALGGGWWNQPRSTAKREAP